MLAPRHMHGADGAVMRPYLHFSGGDSLWISGWAPNAIGPILGACIGLILLAVLDRLLVAARSVIERDWVKRELEVRIANASDVDLPTSSSSPALAGSPSVGKSSPKTPSSLILLALPRLVNRGSSSSSASSMGLAHAQNQNQRRGLYSGWSWTASASRDLSRGLYFLLQAALTYTLMLAVMTFNASYIISVLIGLGVGETLFGRFNGGASPKSLALCH